MNKTKTRGLLVVSGLISIMLGISLTMFFIFICFEGMINGFAYFGVLASFNEILGLIALISLLFSLILYFFSVMQFKLSLNNPNIYNKRKIILICSLIVYLSLMAISAFCVFEAYSDLSSVGVALNSSNMGLISIGVLVFSFIAFISTIIDLFAFKHDLNIGLIKLNPSSPKLLLNAPESNENITKLNDKIEKLGSLKEQGILTEDEFKEIRKDVIDHYFE